MTFYSIVSGASHFILHRYWVFGHTTRICKKRKKKKKAYSASWAGQNSIGEVSAVVQTMGSLGVDYYIKENVYVRVSGQLWSVYLEPLPYYV
jgi:hypothetical protein